ncbi:MAG: hypothetical protein BWY82_02065 [Verrucomicrobia bacterium ADurb.Bin474]|nr:MAG: hypothetical protein BWY82_02065 [Verrucomicrobia bacterium ADurb.Bin474]
MEIIFPIREKRFKHLPVGIDLERKHTDVLCFVVLLLDRHSESLLETFGLMPEDIVKSNEHWPTHALDQIHHLQAALIPGRMDIQMPIVTYGEKPLSPTRNTVQLLSVPDFPCAGIIGRGFTLIRHPPVVGYIVKINSLHFSLVSPIVIEGYKRLCIFGVP